MTTCWHEEKRLFFVHVPKCAGTAVAGHVHSSTQKWTDCWLNQVLPGWTREGLPNGHQPVFSIPRWTGKSLDWWRAILVPIRNPFHQQLSQYLFWRLRGRTNAANNRAYHEDDLFAIQATFEEFLEDPRSNGPMAYCGERWHFAGGVYRWWVSDHEDYSIPPNVRIICVEDMPEVLQAALTQYGGTDGVVPLPRINAQPPADLAEYYTPRAIKAVVRKFSWSLSTHYPEALTEITDLVNSKAVAVSEA